MLCCLSPGQTVTGVVSMRFKVGRAKRISSETLLPAKECRRSVESACELIDAIASNERNGVERTIEILRRRMSAMKGERRMKDRFRDGMNQE